METFDEVIKMAETQLKIVNESERTVLRGIGYALLALAKATEDIAKAIKDR